MYFYLMRNKEIYHSSFSPLSRIAQKRVEGAQSKARPSDPLPKIHTIFSFSLFKLLPSNLKSALGKLQPRT